MMIDSQRRVLILVFVFAILAIALASCGDQFSVEELAETAVVKTAAVVFSSPDATDVSSEPVLATPTSLPTLTNTPMPLGGGGVIAFVSSRDGNMEIYAINADGSRLTRLTNNPGDDFAPEWSPYNDQIAFLSQAPGGLALIALNSHGDGLYRVSGLVDKVSSDFMIGLSSLRIDSGFSWSVNGQIAYSRYRCAQNCGELPCAPIPTFYSGNTQKDIDAKIEAAEKKWSECADAYHKGLQASDEIYLIASDGSEEQYFTLDPSANFADPTWSPNGEQMAIRLTDYPNKGEIYLLGKNGKKTLRLTNDQANDYHPAWSPKGEWIVFVSDRDDNPEIYKMKTDGSGISRLTENPADDHSPVWSPDGSMIAFVSNRDGNQEIYVMRADGSDVTRLTNEMASDSSPTWSSSVSMEDIRVPEITIVEDIYYATDFEEMNSWYSFKFGSKQDDDYIVELSDDSMYIEVNEEQTTVYAMYAVFLEQADLRLDAVVEKVAGTNRNNISLICRATHKGWYEFSISSGGLWYIWKYVDGDYILLASGGSNEINKEYAGNEIAAVCEGSILTLFVNGIELGSTHDSQFKTGYYGVSVTTFDISGAGIEFDKFTVSVP